MQSLKVQGAGFWVDVGDGDGGGGGGGGEDGGLGVLGCEVEGGTIGVKGIETEMP